jgi:hypothetical protein
MKVNVSVACTKTCPLVRIIPEKGSFAWQFGTEGDECLGDGCMAWRWVDSKQGYCGMAGKITRKEK